MNKKILYIGNNLNKKNKYPTALTTLVANIRMEKYDVIVSSSKPSKVLRLIDMILSLINNRKIVEYVLIDTYSTSNFYFALTISQLSRLFRIKYIPILHGGNLPIRLKNNKYFSKLIFKYSYKNVAPSSYLKSIFKNYGFNSLNIANTINIKNYFFKQRNSYKPKLFWVRSFKTIYNPILALEVLKLLKRDYPEATLCMVGPFFDNTHNEALVYIKKNGLDSSVEFTGALSKEKWHKKSERFDIFINTTNVDNTPVSVIEAMALGLPVVSTNVGGIPFLINDKVDGILVEKCNANQMKKAIVSIINNEFPDISFNARKKVEMFDWSVIRYKWLNILKL